MTRELRCAVPRVYWRVAANAPILASFRTDCEV